MGMGKSQMVLAAIYPMGGRAALESTGDIVMVTSQQVLYPLLLSAS